MCTGLIKINKEKKKFPNYTIMLLSSASSIIIIIIIIIILFVHKMHKDTKN